MARVLGIFASVCGLVGVALAGYGIFLGGARSAMVLTSGVLPHHVVLFTAIALPMAAGGLALGIASMMRSHTLQEDSYWVTPAMALNVMTLLATAALWLGK